MKYETGSPFHTALNIRKLRKYLLNLSWAQMMPADKNLSRWPTSIKVEHFIVQAWRKISKYLNNAPPSLEVVSESLQSMNRSGRHQPHISGGKIGHANSRVTLLATLLTLVSRHE